MISLWCGEFYASSSALHCMDCPLDQCGFLWSINQLHPCITLAFICPCCVVVTLPSASFSCSEICSIQLLFRVGMLQFGFGFVCNLFALHFVQACQPENCHGDYSRTFSIALAHSIALVLAVSTAWAHDPRCPQCPTVANNWHWPHWRSLLRWEPWLHYHLCLLRSHDIRDGLTMFRLHALHQPCQNKKRKRNSTKGGNCGVLLHSPKWVPNSTQDEVYGWGAYWLLTYTIVNFLGFLST